MSTTVKPDLRMQVTVRPNHAGMSDFFAVEVAPVIVVDGDVLTVQWWGYQYPTSVRPLAGMQVNGQADRSSAHTTGIYGGKPAYDLSRADAEQLSAAARTLTKVNRKIDALRDRFGYEADFAAHCGYVADAIGATHGNPFCAYTRDLRPDGTYWRWMDVDGLRSHLRDQIEAWYPAPTDIAGAA